MTPFESRRLLGAIGITVEATPTFSAAAHRYFDGRARREPRRWSPRRTAAGRMGTSAAPAGGGRGGAARRRPRNSPDRRTCCSPTTRRSRPSCGPAAEAEPRRGVGRRDLEEVAIPVARGQSIPSGGPSALRGGEARPRRSSPGRSPRCRNPTSGSPKRSGPRSARDPEGERRRRGAPTDAELVRAVPVVPHLRGDPRRSEAATPRRTT